MFELLTRFGPYACRSRAAGQLRLQDKHIVYANSARSCSDRASCAVKMAAPEVVPITIDGRLYRAVREGQANILAPYSLDNAKSQKTIPQSGQPRNNDEGDQAVFYNPIQQYNRDLSVLAILVYGESTMQLKREKHEKNVNLARQKKKKKTAQGTEGESRDVAVPSLDMSSKKRKVDEAGLDEQPETEMDVSKRKRNDSTSPEDSTVAQGTEAHQKIIHDSAQRQGAAEGVGNCDTPTRDRERPGKIYRTPFTILDALSASGLRAIRYAKEIPFSTTIIANDYSPESVKAIELNIQHNGLADKVFPNLGDARQYMYSKTGNESAQKGPSYVHKFDVVDLDPYGTAAPFLDAAIQAVVDGGMLCITCTDAGVWASNGYPEKAYALYAGITLKGPQSHEAGLRIILHAIATSAAKYGVAIEPLLSLSIDFYARLFVRVHKSQQDVKLLAGTTMLVYNCDQGCGAWETQLVARNQERKAKNGDSYFKHGYAQAPSTERYCEHCGTKSHLGGPMWAGPLHNPAFIQKILNRLPHVDKTVYGTTDRIKGMLTVALEEEDIPTPSPEQGFDAISSKSNGHAPDAKERGESSAVIPRLPTHLLSVQPFFFLPTYLAKVLSLPTPSDDAFRGAFLGLGYTCTRSHCKPGSFKTNAPWNVIWEVMREWARQKEPSRIPRLLGLGEFEDRASVKKSSPGAKILSRLRGRSDNLLPVMQLKQLLLEKLGDGMKSVDVRSASDLRDLLTSTLYDLEHLSNEKAQKQIESSNGNVGETEMGDRSEALRLSGKALIDNGGDPSELNIVFDAEKGRQAPRSKGDKLVRYQINPRAHWGPMVRAGAGT